ARNVTEVQTCALPICFRFKSPFDAITSAMKRGFTRDKKTNQGNGLWGMSQLILNNRGILNIISSGAIVGYNSKAELFKRELSTRSEERRVGKENGYG